MSLDLLTRWHEAGDYMYLLGNDAYRETMVELLSRAAPRDCAAAGFGCTRRIDRACRAPDVCSQEPAPDVVGDGPREGPVPGACGGFYGNYGDNLRIWIRFSARNRHRAVFWVDDRDPVMLWVDGLPVGREHWLDTLGYWVGDRFLVVEVQGPEAHPAQRYVISALVTAIVSVLIYDAELSSTLLLVPEPDELWTDPRVVRHGDALDIYPDLAALDAGKPDRSLSIT
jgi:hypothetical protein